MASFLPLFSETFRAVRISYSQILRTFKFQGHLYDFFKSAEGERYAIKADHHVDKIEHYFNVFKQSVAKFC